MTTEECHLSSDEVEDLLRLIEQSKTIVVGGQALALWSRLFLERDPKIAAYYSLSSDDLDVFGSAAEARSLAQQLTDAELLIPDAWDNSPNAAVVTGRLGNHRIRVDYMRSVLGVTDKTLKKNYVTLTKQTDRGPLSIHLMHPIDCLRSRLSNINDLHREGLHAVSSAKAALAVTDIFIDQTIALGNFREAQAMDPTQLLLRNKGPAIAAPDRANPQTLGFRRRARRSAHFVNQGYVSLPKLKAIRACP